jgi:hypothetical protein
MILAFFVIKLNSVFYYQQIGSGFGYGIIVCDYNGDSVEVQSFVFNDLMFI